MKYRNYFIYVSLFVLMFSFSGNLNSESIFDYSFDTSFGMKYGTVDELVFQGDSRISKLVWDQHFSPYIQSDIHIKIWQFFLTGTIASVFPVKSGNMEDFDYLTGIPGEISKYSFHDAYLDKDFKVQAQLAFRIKLHRAVHVFPTVGFSFQNRKWSAADGYLQHPQVNGAPWTGEEEKRAVHGTIISYEQALWCPRIGINSKFFIHDKVFLGLDITWIPYVFSDSLDSHFLRSEQFYDLMRGGYGLECAAEAVFFPFSKNPNLGIILNFGYERQEVYGNTSSNSIGEGNSGFQISRGYGSGTLASLFTFYLGISYNPLFWK